MKRADLPKWLQGIVFPSTYGDHALDEDGHCRTADPGNYRGQHRKED